MFFFYSCPTTSLLTLNIVGNSWNSGSIHQLMFKRALPPKFAFAKEILIQFIDFPCLFAPLHEFERLTISWSWENGKSPKPSRYEKLFLAFFNRSVDIPTQLLNAFAEVFASGLKSIHGNLIISLWYVESKGAACWAVKYNS